MALLATVKDVLENTGVSVGSEMIRRAQTIIDLVCGRDLSDPEVTGALSTRDTNRLKLAVVYQAAWMDGHPEVFATMDVAAINQDDLAVTFRDDPQAQLISPLAKVALSRMSWRSRGMTSVSVNSVFTQSRYVEDWRPIR